MIHHSLQGFWKPFQVFFVLTTIQEANLEMHFSDVVGAGIRSKLYFAYIFNNTVALFGSGEFIKSIAIDAGGPVIKNG